MAIDSDILSIFLAEALGYLTTLEDAAAPPATRARAAHGLKGAASMLGLAELEGCGRRLERAFEATADAEEVAAELGRVRSLIDDLGRAAAAAEEAPGPAEQRSTFDDDWDPETARMLRALFVEEAHDHLEAIASALLRLERDPGRGAIEEMLRKAHTLKGSASTVGLARVAEAAHRLEELLIGLRDGASRSDGRGSFASDSAGAAPLRVEAALADRLLASVDLLRNMVDASDRPEGAMAELLDRFTRSLRELPAPGDAAPARAPDAPQLLPAEPAIEPDGVERRSSDRRAGFERRWGEQRVRVDVKRLDQLMNSVGELVIDRTRVERRVEDLRALARDLAVSRRALHTALGDLRSRATEAAVTRLREVDVEVADAVTSLERATAALSEDSEALRRSTHALQDALAQVRMMPIHWLHARLQRPLRGMARSQGKLVELTIDDESSEMDRSTAEQVSDSLLQLVRNAVAHGIEPPAVREARGKPPVGRIRISARHVGDFVYVDVEDDGAGIDVDELRRALAAQGRVEPAALAAASAEEVLEHIFDPGFSTRTRAELLAGRGVGLDLVRQGIASLGGSIQVGSRPGCGTRFTLQVPMSTAIAQALLFKVGEPVYALPVSHVVETLYADPADLREDPQRGSEVQTRQGWLPLLHLHALLGGEFGLPAAPPSARGPELPLQRVSNPGAPLAPLAGPPTQARQAVIVAQFANVRFGLTCTRVIGPREIVLKPIGRLLADLPLYASATISGSSKVQFVLDVASLARLAACGAQARSAVELAPAAPGPTSASVRILLADDSRAIREAVGHILRGAGYSVDVAADGWEAWERLQLRCYDLLVTDLEMPRLHGYELIARCRESSALARMPIVVLTSRTAELNREGALARGASAFIAKPVNRRLVLQHVHAALGSDGPGCPRN